jgi:hypothetical protein
MVSDIAKLLDGARNCVRNWAKVEKDESVLITTDTSIHPLVVEAFHAAASEVGARVGVAIIPATEYAEMGLLPKWYPKAVLESDVTIDLGYHFNFHYYGGLGPLDALMKKNNLHFRVVTAHTINIEHLASKWATFPREVELAIGKKAIDHVRGGKKITITDPEGTNITCEGYGIIGGKDKNLGSTEFFYRTFQGVMVGLDPKPELSCNGVIVSSSTHTDPITTMKVTIERGQAVKVEGGGTLGKRWTQAFEKGKNISWGNDHPGPGCNWVEEFMWGTHPKPFRLDPRGMPGQSRDSGWEAGDRRAGVLHTGIGSGQNLPIEGLPKQHRDLTMYHPTVVIDGKTVIEDGHLLALDDSEVRQVAEKYGDPDELLGIEWEP